MVHLGDNLPKGKDQEKIQGHLSCRSYFLESNSAVCLRVRLKNQAPDSHRRRVTTCEMKLLRKVQSTSGKQTGMRPSPPT